MQPTEHNIRACHRREQMRNAGCQGIETATFHILTPYPSTALHARMQREGRIRHSNWDLYDTRHAVFQPKYLTPEQLEAGYWQAYKDFYRWGSIVRSAGAKPTWSGQLRHVAYAAGWKKFEPLWDFIIRLRQVATMLPLLETILSEFGKHRAGELGGLGRITDSIPGEDTVAVAGHRT